MPVIDNAARRRELNRQLALSRRRGDFITAGAPAAVSTLVVNGRPVTMRPQLPKADIEAAAKAEEKARWDFSFKYGVY